jgi:hypothetical protein
MPASCKTSRQAHATSNWLGATLWRDHGRHGCSAPSACGSRVAMHHKVRAAAMRKRKVVAPTLCATLRHWSCALPYEAWPSRISRAMAQRSSYVSNRVWGDSDTAGRQQASRGLRRPTAWRRLGWAGPSRCGRQTTTTRSRRAGQTLCPIPPQAWMQAPAAGGCGGHAGEGGAKVWGEPSMSPFLRGAPRWPFLRGGGG